MRFAAADALDNTPSAAAAAALANSCTAAAGGAPLVNSCLAAVGDALGRLATRSCSATISAASAKGS